MTGDGLPAGEGVGAAGSAAAPADDDAMDDLRVIRIAVLRAVGALSLL